MSEIVAVYELDQPVATDLRTLVTSLRMSADLERVGDLAQHLARLTQLRHPAYCVPRDLRRTILEMGQLAQRLMAALQLEHDDRMDDLHRTRP